VATEDLLFHNEHAHSSRAYLLSRMRQPELPEPIGVFRCVEESVYEEEVINQVEQAIQLKGQGDLHQLYHAADTWEVFPDIERANGRERHSGEATPHSINTDTLADLEPQNLIIASVDISLAEAVDKLKEGNVGFVALVDKKDKLVGAFTEADILAKVSCKIDNLHQAKVKDYMTSPVTTLRADASIACALQLMANHRFRHIPIVDDEGKPEGVVSFRSVVHYLEEYFSPSDVAGK
jgi:CBS domain-containing protein